MTTSIVVAPPHLNFYTHEPEQTFEIFNVHPYPVKFMVKATAPEKYIISNTEGMINTQCKISITVTHVDLCVTNENVRDKFRIYFSLLRSRKLEAIGHRDISAVLFSPRGASPSAACWEGGALRETTTLTRRSSHPSAHATRSVTVTSSHLELIPVDEGHHLLVYLVPMILGVGALWMPTLNSVPGTPWFLELSEGTKNTICFFLGMLAVLFYQRVQQSER